MGKGLNLKRLMTVEGLNSAWVRFGKARSDALQRARKLVDLKVNEVSVVDRPAIMREFLLIKRLEEEDTMPKKNKASAQEAALTRVTEMLKGANGGFAVSGELPKELAARAGSVAEWMTKMAAGTDDEATKASILETAALITGIQKGEFGPEEDDDDDDGGDDAGDGDVQATTKSGGDKKKALSLDGTETKKTSGTTIQIGDDGTVQISQVGKSAEAQKIATTKAAFMAVASQLGDLDLEELAKAVGELVEKQLPDRRVMRWGRGVDPSGVGAGPVTRTSDGVDMTKNADDDPLAELTKAVKGLSQRMENVEKTRSPSTAVNGDEGGEGGEDKKAEVKKGFWGGLL